MTAACAAGALAGGGLPVGGGELGYGNTNNIGGTPTSTPGAAGPVDLGAGRTAVAISAGAEHTCARLDDGSVRCWGHGLYGRLGYCSDASVGETNAPGSVGPVNLVPGAGGTTCPNLGTLPPSGAPVPIPAGAPAPTDPFAIQALRANGWHRCLARAAHRPKLRRARARRACLRRYGRTPGPIAGLRALALGETEITLDFNAPGSDGPRPPAARGYLIKQSSRPIRTKRDFALGQPLCRGDCRFAVASVGASISLTVTGLRPDSAYYYAIAARDNVSNRSGPRSRSVKATTG